MKRLILVVLMLLIMVNSSYAGFQELAVNCGILENQVVVLSSCQFSNTANSASNVYTNMFSEAQYISVANGMAMSNILARTNSSGFAFIRFFTSTGTVSAYGCTCQPLSASWGRYTGNIGGGSIPSGLALNGQNIIDNTTALAGLKTTLDTQKPVIEANTDGSLGLASVMGVFSTDSIYFLLGTLCASIFLSGVRMRL